MVYRNSGVFLFFMILIFLCGSLMFLCGFFPDAYVKDGIEHNGLGKERPNAVKGYSITPPPQKHEQIILMIVDALGFSFVNPTDSMPFVHNKRCDRLKLRVAIPTVTLPRIKSLTTGTISNFIDIIRNLGETEQLTDSLLHVLNKHKRMINFAGDRTWAGLFPAEFTRKRANTDSFFVNDFYEGDRQIIETLRKEIDEEDWSLLILHFLGFDHIGHVEGSSSAKIPNKLKEMDSVVKEIFENKYFKNRLLLVTGDHGMRIGGGHGGSTEEELTVPLLVFNKNCDKNVGQTMEYNQIDLTPTLALLMSVEIPKPSIGKIIPELLQNFTYEERLYACFYNTQHLMHKANIKYGESNVKERGYADWFETAQVAHKKFMEAQKKGLPVYFYYEQAIKYYQHVSDEISKSMSNSLVKFDYGLIGVGIFLTTTATVYAVISLVFAENRPKDFNKSDLILNIALWIISLVIALIVNLTSQELDLISANTFQRSCLFTAALTISVYLTLSILKAIQQLLIPLPTTARFKRVWAFPKPLLAAFLITIFNLGSSSFIEFEHVSWHYLGVTCLIWLGAENFKRAFKEQPHQFENVGAYLFACLRKNKTALCMSLTTLSFCRFASVLNAASNRVLTSRLRHIKLFASPLLFIASLVYLLLRLRKHQTPNQRKASIGVAVSIVLFRAFQGKLLLVLESIYGCTVALWFFWFLVCVMCFANCKSLLSDAGKRFERIVRNVFIGSIWISALLQKPHNVVLLPCLLHVLECAYDYCDQLNLFMREPYRERYKLACKTILTLFIANMFFFYQGNSNSLATIDLNPGYIGQSTYNPVIVGIFVTLNTYSAPINAFLYFVLHLLQIHMAQDSRYSLHDMPITARREYENLTLVLSLYTTATLLPVAFYLGLMIIFRYHLFIYSVFAPKAFYECYGVVVFYFMYCLIQIFKFLSK